MQFGAKISTAVRKVKLFKSFNTFKQFKTLESGTKMEAWRDAIMCLRPNTPLLRYSNTSQSSYCLRLVV